jgi:hypothetical protein
VSDDLNDDREWHLLYSAGSRIARYSYFDDESLPIVERRHGEHAMVTIYEVGEFDGLR